MLRADPNTTIVRDQFIPKFEWKTVEPPKKAGKEMTEAEKSAWIARSKAAWFGFAKLANRSLENGGRTRPPST